MGKDKKDKVELTRVDKHYVVRCNLEEYVVVERYEPNVNYTGYEVVGVEDEALKGLIIEKLKAHLKEEEKR